MPPPKFNPVRDVISGAIMAATSVPQLIAYAEMVGYAGARGLSTAGPSLFAWGLFTGSPFMNSGVTSITALMAKSDLDGESFLSEHGEEEYVKLVSAYTMYIGLASIILAFTGFGKLAQSVPQPVRRGFKWGTACGVFVNAVPNGLFAGGAKELKAVVADSAVGDFVQMVKSNFPAATGAVNVSNTLYAITHPQLWAFAPTLVFALCTAFVMNGKKILPKVCPPGTEVIIATAAATLYSMNYEYNGGIVGEIPAIDPDAGVSFFGGRITLPVEFLDVKSLFTDVPIVERFGNSWVMLFISATLFAGVNFLSIMGTISVFEVEDNIPWSARRELIAQGVSCGVAGAVGSAPVSGSMSRSLGFAHDWDHIANGMPCDSDILDLPVALHEHYESDSEAALSAVILSAVVMSVVMPKDLMKMKGCDFIVGWGTALSTACTSPTIGFAIGLVFYTVL